MDIFWVSYICLMLMPLLGIIAGATMWKYSPHHFYAFIAFRTSRSMRNGETWKYANTTAGRLLVRYCLMMLIISGVLPFLFMNARDASFEALTMVLLCAQACTLAACLIATQILLIRHYPDGARSRRK